MTLKGAAFFLGKIPHFIPLLFTGSKYISKSEDNLLTPQCASSARRTSWSVETPVGTQAFSGGSFTDTPMNMCLKSSYTSEPAIVLSKPPAVVGLPKKLCCASSSESLDSEICVGEAESQTGATLIKIKEPFTESRVDLQTMIQEPCSSAGSSSLKPSDSIIVPPPETPTEKVLGTETLRFPAQERYLANDQNITFSQFDIAALSPLHIDSVVFESGVYYRPPSETEKDSLCAAPVSSRNSSMVGEKDTEAEQVNCSRLVDALDIHSPVLFKLGVSHGLQSTPYKLDVELDEELTTVVSAKRESDEAESDSGSRFQNHQALYPHSPETEKRRVVDHIQHFNKLTLCSPRASRATRIRSPLKFQRTPVHQAVRRINSLMGGSRRPSRNAKLTHGQGSQVVKAVSLESGLSPRPQLRSNQCAELSDDLCQVRRPPPVPPKKPSTSTRKPKTCVLGDVTNKLQPKTKTDGSVGDRAGAQKPVVQQLSEKDMTHYRGSPRNPLNQARLLSATKPVDL